MVAPSGLWLNLSEVTPLANVVRQVSNVPRPNGLTADGWLDWE